MKLTHTRIGSTLYLHDDATTEHVRKKILPDGWSANYADGSSEWVVEVVDDHTKEGSERYTWDKSGNRVKHARVRYRKDKAGKVTRTVEGIVFKKF